MRDVVVGQVLGRYELLLPIAKGGMAEVWAARLRGTRGFQKIVAVKTILPGSMDDERMERMFLEEATLASQIHHPNVVGTLELGEQDGILYLVMEWVDGESLNFILNRASRRIPLPIAVNLVGQACKGLHAAHDLRDESGALMGVVHRDISAQNVLVTYSGNAKLVDFGIAKATARASGLTEAGEIKGKFAYLSPEQARGEAIDRRTDVFGMGILLYLMTTGRHPFKAANPGETLLNICSSKPAQPPSELVSEYPTALEGVVCKALAKEPDQRFATANDMLEELENAMPECLEGSFEVKIAEYMSGLLGNRSRERRTELKLAQQMLDARAEGMPVDALLGASGSLRGISVDGSEPKIVEDSQSQRKSRNEISSGNVVATVGGPAGWSRRGKIVLATATVGAAMFATGARQMFREHTGERAAAAASPVPAATIAPLPEPERQPAAPIVSAAPSSASADDANAARRSKKAPAAARSNGAAPSPAPVASAPAAAPERPRESRDAASNAWDPGSFGGRR